MNTTSFAKPKTKSVQLETAQSDEQLLLDYRDTGNREYFAALVRRYERELYGYLRRYLGDAEMAEDAFQATFLQVHLKCQHFEPGRKLKPWLYAVATNQAIDAQRRNRRHKMVSLDRGGSGDQAEVGKLLDTLLSEEPSPTVQLSEFEKREWMDESIAKLPEGLRDAISLVYFQEMKYREAAEVLGIPVGTVKSRLHAAIAKLNESYRQTFAETP
ncbi:MAG: RNA polymerase sigma factor [Pirellulales bacterium]